MLYLERVCQRILGPFERSKSHDYAYKRDVTENYGKNRRAV